MCDKQAKSLALLFETEHETGLARDAARMFVSSDEQVHRRLTARRQGFQGPVHHSMW